MCNTPTMQLSRHFTAAIVRAVTEITSQRDAGSPCQDAPLGVWTEYAARHLTTLSWLEAEQLHRRCEGLRQTVTGRHIQDLMVGNTLLLRSHRSAVDGDKVQWPAPDGWKCLEEIFYCI